MTASRIDKLRAIVEAMTPGPWRIDSGTCSDETGEVWCWSDIVSDAARERVLSGVGDEREDRLDHYDRVGPSVIGGGLRRREALRAALDALYARIAALPDGGERG